MGFGKTTKQAKRTERRFTFTLSQIGELVDLTQRHLRALVLKGELDPTDLESVVAFVAARSPRLQRAQAQLLFAAGCDPTKAATILGVSRSTLYRRKNSRAPG